MNCEKCGTKMILLECPKDFLVLTIPFTQIDIHFINNANKDWFCDECDECDEDSSHYEDSIYQQGVDDGYQEGCADTERNFHKDDIF